MLDLFIKTLSLSLVLGFMSGCTTNSAIRDQSLPIDNPFGAYDVSQRDSSKNITFRSKRGDQAVEVEIPGDREDVVVPMNNRFNSAPDRNPASVDGVDYTYSDSKPTPGDREIASTFSGNQNPHINAFFSHQFGQKIGHFIFQ